MAEDVTSNSVVHPYGLDDQVLVSTMYAILLAVPFSNNETMGNICVHHWVIFWESLGELLS